MNRLQSELNRLYLTPPTSDEENGDRPPTLIGSSNRVRAMVMELKRPPDWVALAKVWQGVQAEFGLPAPAIAVSGLDGLQLWFSVAQPIAVEQAHAFLECLHERYLGEIDPGRVSLMPTAHASSLHRELHARLVPACQEASGNWSAFLAPDLVPVFADSPWLDTPPNEEGQASLLQGIEVTKQAAFEAAFEKLRLARPAARPAVAVATSVEEPESHGRSQAIATHNGPERFLLDVMNDATVALGLRIEAAKALLQHANDLRPTQADRPATS